MPATSFLLSLEEQMAPASEHEAGDGRERLTSALELGVTVISQRSPKPLVSRALVTVPPADHH